MRKLKILAGRSHPTFAAQIAAQLNTPLSNVNYIKFENDNLLVQIQENVRECDVFFIQTTVPPVQECIIETLMVINALKHSSAARITTVLPYFPYARSDKKDQPRISITARLIADILETAGSNRVLTMDLHSPQIQGFFSTPCDQLIAARNICGYLLKQKDLSNCILVAPDVGRSKAIAYYNQMLHLPLAIIDKKRSGNNDDITPMHLIGEVKGKDVLMIDDEIASGSTLTKSAAFLVEKGAKRVTAVAVHPIFSGKVVENINKSPISELIITDSIPINDKARNCIKKISILSVSNLFASAIKRIHEGESVSDLF